MQVGIVGLGKMGLNMAFRILEKGYEVVGYNRSPGPGDELIKAGGKDAKSFDEFTSRLKKPRTIILSVPHGAIDEVLFGENGLVYLFESGDTLIDAGNSEFWKTRERFEKLKGKEINFIDVGISGGPTGARNGAAVMVGGDEKLYKKYEGLFKDMATEDGYGYFGASGAGHFVKMIHNAIEYGMMQSIAEGFELVNSGPYEKVDLKNLAKVWNHGTVIRGFLMEKMQQALEIDPNLSTIDPSIGAGDLGETRWAIKTAIDNETPFDSPARALFARFRSRQEESFATKVIGAMRTTFGGHKAKDTLKKTVISS